MKSGRFPGQVVLASGKLPPSTTASATAVVLGVSLGDVIAPPYLQARDWLTRIVHLVMRGIGA